MLGVMLVNGRSECKAGGVAPRVVHKAGYGTVREGEMSTDEPQKPDGFVTLGDVALHPCSIH